jgi:hypothetical protein
MAMNERRRTRTAASQNSSHARIDDAIAARPALKIEIDEVVLRGINVGGRSALAAALERELTSMLSDGETTRTLRSNARERIDGGTIFLEANRDVPGLGREIAQAVQRSLIELMPMQRTEGSKH